MRRQRGALHHARAGGHLGDLGAAGVLALTGTKPNGYLVFVLAGSFRKCSKCAVLKCVFAWRTRYPLI